jgi:hypothetical protein
MGEGIAPKSTEEGGRGYESSGGSKYGRGRGEMGWEGSLILGGWW